MAQQTAVDWFVKQIQTRLDNYGEVNFFELAKEAKAMEKEQIIDAVVQYLIKHRGLHTEISILQTVELSEQYYNKTYNK